MKKIVGSLVLALLLLVGLGFFSLVVAEETYGLNDTFAIKIGDQDWECKVTDYQEGPKNSKEKSAKVFFAFINQGSAEDIQKFTPNNYKFYLIDGNDSAHEIDMLARDPGKNLYGGRVDVLPGKPLPLRAEFSLPKETATKQFMIYADVATPPQVAVNIPSSMVLKPVDLPTTNSGTSGRSGNYSSGPRTIEQDAQVGIGVMAGHILALSGVYWMDGPLGAQVMVGSEGSTSISINARGLLKFFALPFGRLAMGPQVGYQFEATTGDVSRSTYGVVMVAEFVMPVPVRINTGKAVTKGNSWLSLSLFEKAQAIGLSAEIGMFGNGIRNINLSVDQLTPGVTMAGHIYL
ncbi:MAG: hypothetical protein ABH823_03350 [bacterium]